MAFSPARGGSIERNNKLNDKPFTRQSQLYREKESGNGMKGVLGHDHLAWDPNRQQGAFEGQSVYNAKSQQYQQLPPAAPQFGGPGDKRASFAPGTNGPTRENGNGPMRVPPQQMQQMQRQQQMQMQMQQQEEAEYPLPGSSAGCDLCGDTITRYYHCADCREETGLFDLCVVCCGAVYLQQGPPPLLQQARQLRHPTHDFKRHTMVHVTPTGGA